MRDIIIFLKNIILIVLLLSVFSCNKKNSGFTSDAAERGEVIPLYRTWLSLKEMEYREPAVPLAEEIPAGGFLPWAGIVSHHILAHDYIDAWFSVLAEIRDIDNFFIISPDHYRISLQPYSLTIGSWDSGFGLVESDRETVFKLAESLEVNLDPNVFIIEHGISALMPYIKKYFPETKTAAIIVRGESEVNTLTALRLANLLEEEFDAEGKSRNFLLISSDFSHGGNIDKTALNDFHSALYLQNAEGSFWNMVNCDNRIGIYILDCLGRNNMKSHILYHTNSFKISGADEDITSYFFVYFSDKR